MVPGKTQGNSECHRWNPIRDGGLLPRRLVGDAWPLEALHNRAAG